mmetsp:Transcript_40754/g.41344  ORF Transcript_40754/g.41344 Transcript_40754/m.41344 type:complete len:103 (-) Transcript_40754:331-639(-)
MRMRKKIRNEAQDKVIARWKEQLYFPLAKALSVPDDTAKNVKEMQADTIQILMKLDPDYIPPNEFLKKMSNTRGIPVFFLILGLIVALVAILLVASSTIKSN